MKKIVLGVMACSLLALSCKKKGCVDEVAKNYDVEAKKDDGTCEYYTNTEFLTMDVWKYSSLSTTGSNEADMKTFFTGSTFNFKTDGTVVFTFPNEPTASETKTWEFTSNETKILLDKGEDSEDTIDVPTLDIANLTIKFTDEDTGAIVTVNWVH